MHEFEVSKLLEVRLGEDDRKGASAHRYLDEFWPDLV